jgi:type II secretory pathway component PulM
MSATVRLAALPPASRRAIALLLLALALVVAWAVIVLPVSALLASQQEWRADVARDIARDRGMISTAAQLSTAGTQVETSPLRGRLYGAGSGTPADQLQNDLRAALLAGGVEPTNFKVLPSAASGGLRVHRVEFASVMSVDQLKAFFLALEQQPHHVRVERLRLDAPSTQRTDENPRINVLMEVRGFSAETAAPASAVRVASAN